MAKSTLYDAPDYISMNAKGQIVIEPVFEKSFDGDMRLLLSCIEDNILPDDEGAGEHIDWSMVFDDYRESDNG